MAIADFSGRLVGVVDGDSIKVLHEATAEAVRLAGIDTPEMKGQCEREKQFARQARDLVRSSLGQAGTIHLRRASRDKYFRIDARVLADGKDLSEILITQGVAVPYDGGTKIKDWCAHETEIPAKGIESHDD